MPVLVGEIIAGKYQVERVLGEGGMGIVLAVRHLDLNELYAIKIMKRAALGVDAHAKHRFFAEARAAARLKGQHIARVHDIGRLDSGEPYMVMEHLQGTDLKALLQKQGPLPLHEAVMYVLQTCEAIAEAHALDIIHRDIKPQNLFLLDDTKSIKVLDFGISKQRTAHNVALTGSNVLLGTPYYMSPEQMEGSKCVEARSDIWSIGVVIYELVTGTVPFPGQNLVEIFKRIFVGTPTPPSQLRPDLPAGIDTVVQRCLQREPARRFTSVGELASALRALVETWHHSHTSRVESQSVVPDADPTEVMSPPSSIRVQDQTTREQRQPGSRRHRSTRRLLRWGGGLAIAGLVVLAIAVVPDHSLTPFSGAAAAQQGRRVEPSDESATQQHTRSEPPDAMTEVKVHEDAPEPHQGEPIAQPPSSPRGSPEPDGRMPIEHPAEPTASVAPRGRNPTPHVRPGSKGHDMPRTPEVIDASRRPLVGPQPPPPVGRGVDVPGDVAINCVEFLKDAFPYPVNLSRYSPIERQRLIDNKTCQGIRSDTQLCCREQIVP